MPDSISHARHAPGLPAAESPIAGLSAAGERPSLAAFFEAEESALLGFAIGLVGRRSVAEELVQEAFLRLHQL